MLNTRLLVLLMALIGGFSLTACDRDEGGFEQMGESMDEAVEEVKDEVDDHTTE